MPLLDPAAMAPDLRAKAEKIQSWQHSAATFIYDPSVALARIQLMRTALPPWIRIHYAMKANSFPSLVEVISPKVDGFDVASESELETARRVSATASISASGPGKSDAFIECLSRISNSIVNVDSVTELHRLRKVAENHGRQQKVALRVSPPYVQLDIGDEFENDGQRFGLFSDDLHHAITYARASSFLELVGFHFHLLSNNLDAARHASYIRWCLSWSRSTAQRAGIDLRYVNVGGGIGVGFGIESEFDLERLGNELKGLETPDFEVVIEPGRYLTADCGWYISDVVDLKVREHESFVVLAGGIHHFQLPTSWDIVHNAVVLPREGWSETYPRPTVENQLVTIIGKLCTTEDTLLRDVAVTRVRVGDAIAFPYAGAYGWEFAMQNFLGHPHAKRALLRSNDIGDD
ncbi:alanine racemase [Rhodococcus sp. NPDC060176]|uniref:alanine racemase n=1 Tax=Rhodococcus sp. NPDC060176 TaxID=3347062 RepID=UPI00364E813F